MARFYRHKPLQFKDYSRGKFFLSVLVGLAITVVFYLFQQYLFVFYRSVILALKFNANHILSEDLGNLVAFIFAGNAVILGNSVAISFYISGVSKTAIKRFRKQNVLNNQSFLIGNYFYWFSKVFFFIVASPLLFSKYNFFEESWMIYIMIFIVLFLESTKELRRSFKGYSIKILVLHFLVIVGLGFTCVLVNKSNYYTLGIIYNTSHPYVNIPSTAIEIPDDIYDYDGYDKFPVSPFNRYQRIPIKVISDSTRLIYKFYNETLSLKEVVNTPSNPKYTNSIRSHIDYDLSIYANYNLAYYRLKDLENKAALRNIPRIEYVMYSVENEREYVYVKNLYPKKSLFEDNKNSFPTPSIFFDYEDFLKEKAKNKEIVRLTNFISKNKVNQQKVYSYFQKSVSDSVFFKLTISKEVTLQQYLDFMIAYKQSVYDLRDEQRSMNKALDGYEINEKLKYPFYLIEDIEE